MCACSGILSDKNIIANVCVQTQSLQPQPTIVQRKLPERYKNMICHYNIKLIHELVNVVTSILCMTDLLWMHEPISLLEERDQVLWVRLPIIEHNKYAWVINIIHCRVILCCRISWIPCWWLPHITTSFGIQSSQHFCQIYVFVAIAVWWRVCVSCRVLGILCKIHTISVGGS